MDFYLIRLEKEENFLIKIKYNQKFIDIFKEIINDNDLSMKESEKARFGHLEPQLIHVYFNFYLF
jgi:hypothetical protein